MYRWEELHTEGFDGGLVLLETELRLEFATFLALDVLVFEEYVQDGALCLGGDRICLEGFHKADEVLFTGLVGASSAVTP